jgi:Sugar (and other) transporter
MKLTASSESPRYLAWIGQDAKAREILQRIHRDPRDSTNSFADAEFIQIVKQIEHDKVQKAGYIQMFIRPSWRKRSVLVMFLTSVSRVLSIFVADISFPDLPLSLPEYVSQTRVSMKGSD